MMMYYKVPEYRKREREICAIIRAASDEFDRLDREGKDPAEALRRLEAALETYLSFRREFV